MFAIAIGSIGLGLAAWGAWAALRQVPGFYRAALATDDSRLARASDELLEQAAALASRARDEGDWHVVLTAEQINGWLAVDMVRNHRSLLPDGFREPRVAIENGRLLLACRYERSGVSAIVTLDVEAYLSASNELALRIHKARAGSLPLPLARLLDSISHTARDLQLHVDWYQQEGDPLALIRLPEPDAEPGKHVTIRTFQLRPGELYVAGRTQHAAGYSPDASPPPRTASESGSPNDTRQQ